MLHFDYLLHAVNYIMIKAIQQMQLSYIYTFLPILYNYKLFFSDLA